jgi:hypothetical protein
VGEWRMVWVPDAGRWGSLPQEGVLGVAAGTRRRPPRTAPRPAAWALDSRRSRRGKVLRSSPVSGPDRPQDLRLWARRNRSGGRTWTLSKVPLCLLTLQESGCACVSESVVRGGVEPPTFRFSGGRSYQLSYLTSAM